MDYTTSMTTQWRSEGGGGGGGGGGGAGGDICPRVQGFRGAKIDNLHR